MCCALADPAELAVHQIPLALAAAGHDSGLQLSARARPESEWVPFTMTEPNPQKGELLPRIARGDADAVGACLERYGALVWSVARKSWKDYATIEDLVERLYFLAKIERGVSDGIERVIVAIGRPGECAGHRRCR